MLRVAVVFKINLCCSHMLFFLNLPSPFSAVLDVAVAFKGQRDAPGCSSVISVATVSRDTRQR